MPARRDAIATAVTAYNQANPEEPLPRNAGRLLLVMFAEHDTCCRSQQDLMASGIGKTLPEVLRRLVAAGFLSKQAGSSRVPDAYRLLLATGNGA
jgi:hypothetical protein